LHYLCENEQLSGTDLCKTANCVDTCTIVESRESTSWYGLWHTCTVMSR